MAEAAAQENKPAGAADAAAAPAEAPVAPIIVKKIILEDGHGGAHGGAWKIALADMMTAMMAFFLLMWLLGATPEDKRKSVADYFRPASHSQIKFGELAGSDGLFGGKSIIDPDGFPFTAKQTALLERLTPNSEGGTKEGESGTDGKGQGVPGEDAKAKEDRENFEKLEKELKEKISQNKALKQMQDQVSISREADGLRIDIIDKADYSMFKLGTNQLDPKAAQLLGEVAKSIKDLPNKLAVRGHTDSLGFAADSGKNNWTLSTERADATRQLMQQSSGLPSSRFQRIEGVADTAPFVPANPSDPRNRRVSITVLNQ
ncbi:flagellar motor protein MotB [Ramlibacter sp. MAHUQ-53]|uniref:flagellar motor protein MotB n=1 Tax=unclassified Ramlibacter TaxID=2617605 RepID=UPI003630FDCD